MRNILLLVLLCFSCLPLTGQQLPVLKYTTSHGLGHQVVYRIHQDPEGLLWFSTDNGLTRFDGRLFKNFTAKDGLRSNFIFSAADHDTTMLVSTFGGGVHSFDGHTFTPLPGLSESVPYPINLLYRDATLWITDRDFNLYRFREGRTRQFKKPRDIFYHNVKPLDSGVFIGSTKIFIGKAESDSLREIPIDRPWPNTSYLNIVPLSGTEWLVSSSAALYRLNVITHRATLVMEGDFSAGTKNMVRVNDDIWVAETKGRVWKLSADLKIHELMFDNVVVNDLFVDREHNLWLATYGHGVWCLPGTSIKKHELPGLLYPTVFYSRQLQLPLLTSANDGTYALRQNTLSKIPMLRDNLDNIPA